MSSLIHSQFSPDCKRLAMSTAPRDAFFHKRDLWIVDAESGKTLFERKRIFVGDDPTYNSIPGLYFSWRDNDTLIFNDSVVTHADGKGKYEGYENSVEVNAVTGKITKELRLFDAILPSYGRPENESKKEPPSVVKKGYLSATRRSCFSPERQNQSSIYRSTVVTRVRIWKSPPTANGLRIIHDPTLTTSKSAETSRILLTESSRRNTG